MIDEPLLRERLAMDDAAFREFILAAVASVGPRPCGDAEVEQALGYPWVRPACSFRLRGEDVEELDALPAGATDGRVGLLAVGSNGAPEALSRKLAHLDEREVTVVAGTLHDLDVGVAAHPTGYGSMPATPFASPGTAVRAALLWVTPAQLTQLTWTEITYRLGVLHGARFTPDLDRGGTDEPALYVSRWGTFSPDGEPFALAALPAEGRRAPARTQEQLLDAAAGIALGPGHHARDLVEAVFADFPGFAATSAERLIALGRPFDAPGFVPVPG